MTMPELPEFARERLRQQRGAESHPDANLISAFVENSLTARERVQVLDHLSRCDSCRTIAGLAMPEQESRPVPIRTAEERSWARWTMMRWATLAASAVVIAVAVLVLRPYERQRPTFSESPSRDVIAPAKAKPEVPPPEQKAPPEEKHKLAESAAGPPRSPAVAKPRSDAARPRSPMLHEPARKQTKGYDKDALVIPARPQAAPAARQQVNIVNSQATNAFTQNMQQQRPGGPFMNQAQIAQQNQNVAAIPSPPPPQSVQDKARANVPRGASETVEVTAAAPPEQTTSSKQEVAKAAPASGMAGGLLRARPMQGVAMKSVAIRWTISSDGKITRSLDAGQTWTEVPIAQGVVFRAISANGADIWAGGSAGALFHSLDGGEQWSRVRPTAAGAELSSDIIRIEFTDPQHGTVLTAGERWATSDAGRSWVVTH